jgi:hypothetical protein
MGCRTVAEDFITQPFRDPKEMAWTVPLPQYQVDHLLRGCIPKRAEDRWFAYADGPGQCGTATLHIFKSPTGNKVAEVTIHIPFPDASGSFNSPPRITHLIWESSKAIMPGNTPERAIQSIREIYTWTLATQQPQEDSQRSLQRTDRPQSSSRTKLSRIRTALGPLPPPPPSSRNCIYKIVDIPGSVASRPTSFYCPLSPWFALSLYDFSLRWRSTSVVIINWTRLLIPCFFSLRRGLGL